MIKILSYLIYGFVKLINFTYRYRYIGNENLLNLKNKKKNFIYAIWHQNLFPGIMAQTGHPHIVIVSKSKDAEAVAFTCKRLGHIVARGSSKRGNVDKGGSLAKDEMIEYLKTGHPGAVTVDGPKGPALKVKPGIIAMSKQSQCPIIPYIVTSNSYWQFNSWDHFRLPKPFAKLLVAYGEPLVIAADCSDFELYQNQLEICLNQLTHETQKNLLNWNHFPKKNWYEF